MTGSDVSIFVGAWLALVAVYFIFRGRIKTHGFEFSRNGNPLGFWLVIGFVLILACSSIAAGLRHHSVSR